MTSAIDLSPFTDDVYPIGAHYGVPSRNVVPAPSQGQVNLTVYLGAELVLRIPRKAKAAEQLAKEAEVIPLVQDAGVPTSGLVSYDATREVGSVPYIVLERLHGATLAERGYDPPDSRRAHESLGEILLALHRIRLSSVGSTATIPAPFTFSPLRTGTRSGTRNLYEVRPEGLALGKAFFDDFWPNRLSRLKRAVEQSATGKSDG